MTSAFIISNRSAENPTLTADLKSAGFDVLGIGEVETMVPDVIRSGPDLVICYENNPDNAFFASTTALRSASPRPCIVFTNDPDAEKIVLATNSGIHAYVINGYGLHRLRSVIHVAQARFCHDQLLRDELSEVNKRLKERKIVDRAKGILMRVRNISEDDAYLALRKAAQQTNQRIGQVAQQVVDAARYADSVNRSGQLRMLSQRLVKLYALMCWDAVTDTTIDLFKDSAKQIESNLAILDKTLSKPTFGDLLQAVLEPWAALKAALDGKSRVDRLPEIDRLAEKLLDQAEKLTKNLETAGFAAALHIINVSGRQRMLSQRIAKYAVMATVSDKSLDKTMKMAASTRKSFIDGMAYLESVPLRTKEIEALLAKARHTWADLDHAMKQGNAEPSLGQIGDLSETLLEVFNDLTTHYERSMQMLMD